MDWIQFSIFAIGVFGLFIWNRTESRADMRHMLNIIDTIKADAVAYRTEMAQEIKDFHGRLCAIEERNKGK